MKRVLLLNPPGSRPYLRDYHCSKVSKAGYLYHPVDLTFQSALLKNKHGVRVIDAIAQRISPQKLIRNITNLNPDAVLCLVGAASWKEDRHFVGSLRRAFNGLLVLTGDIFLEDARGVFQGIPDADAVLLNFTSRGLADWLDEPDKPALDMLTKAGDEIIEGERSQADGGFRIGTPLYNLFPHRKYRYPFVRNRPFATVLTDYGCPFPCSFCIMSAVGYRTRPMDDVMDELRWLAEAGYRELYINDQTFGAKRKRTFALLEAMGREGLRFGWVCFTRADILDEEFARAIKRAGCHTVMFGVENASRDILDTYRKGMDADKAFGAMDLCRKVGLRTVATFLLGFPEDDDLTIEATIRLALELDPDYASFNFAVPRRGTELRRRAVELGLADPKAISMDQGGEEIAMPTKTLSREQMSRWRKRAYSRFYMRPRYILKRAVALKTPYEVTTTVIGGANVVKNALGKSALM